jgi:hypothetical protein
MQPLRKLTTAAYTPDLYCSLSGDRVRYALPSECLMPWIALYEEGKCSVLCAAILSRFPAQAPSLCATILLSFGFPS